MTSDPPTPIVTLFFFYFDALPKLYIISSDFYIYYVYPTPASSNPTAKIPQNSSSCTASIVIYKFYFHL